MNARLVDDPATAGNGAPPIVAMGAYECLPADGDGNADLFDFGAFQACVAGPTGGVFVACAVFDLNADGAVGALDFAVFQIGFTGL